MTETNSAKTGRDWNEERGLAVNQQGIMISVGIESNVIGPSINACLRGVRSLESKNN